MSEVVRLDGSIGEGGGQVLRVALALSAILNKPINIYNIRKKRQNPGLRHQHLTGVDAVGKVCSAQFEGAEIGSVELFFRPGKIKPVTLELDTGTAGSTMLVLQSLLPVLCFGSGTAKFTIKGGTNNPNAPTYEYFEQVFLPAVAMFGPKIELKLLRRGFYPRGNGLVTGSCMPVKKLNPITLRGKPKVIKIFGKAYTSRLPSHVAERMAKSCEKYLIENGYTDITIEKEVLTVNDEKCAIDAGAGICLVAICDGGIRIGVDRLGEKGVPAEKVGQDAALDLISELRENAPVDRHLADMLVIYAALAEGRSVYEVTKLTSHTVTSIEVCKIITGCKANIQGQLNERAVVEIEGIGHLNNNI